MKLRFLALFLCISTFAHSQFNDYPNAKTIFVETFAGAIGEAPDEIAPAFGL